MKILEFSQFARPPKYTIKFKMLKVSDKSFFEKNDKETTSRMVISNTKWNYLCVDENRNINVGENKLHKIKYNLKIKYPPGL